MEKKLKKRSDLHIARKIWHILGVLVIIVSFMNLSRFQSLVTLSFFTLLFVGFDVLRLQYSFLNKIALAVMAPFIREQERNSLAGTTYLLTSSLLVIWLFPKNIALLSLVFLAFADPLACLLYTSPSPRDQRGSRMPSSA